MTVAIYQAGTAIMGTGEDLADALEQASEWADNLPGYEDIEMPVYGETDGQVYFANMSEKLAAEVEENGGNIGFAFDNERRELVALNEVEEA